MREPFSRSDFVTPSDTRLATLHWRGVGPPLTLMHATGFCGSVWDPIARRLADVASPRAMDVRGHGASDKPDRPYPWSVFADDLLAWVRAEGGTPGFGLGHSSGATALLLAAAREPDAFERLVLVDPVLLRPPAERDEDERQGGFGLAERTRKRRAFFPSREAVREAYGRRFPFQGFDPEVFAHYLRDGLVSRHDGVELACPPEIERRIYLGTADIDPWLELPKVRARVRILIPELSGIRPELRERLPRALPQVDLVPVPGTHFVPLEQPGLVADRAREFFR